MSAIAVSVPAPRSGWRQLMGFNLLTGIVLGIGGWFLGHFIGDQFHGAGLVYYKTEAGPERHRHYARLLPRRGRLPGRAGVC